MNWTFTAAGKAAPQNSSSHLTTEEAFRAALDRGFDKVIERMGDQPWEGEQFVRFQKVDRDSGKVTSFRGLTGTVPLSRDGDEMQFVSKGLGFGYNWNTYTRRVAAGIERKAMEIDDIGYTKGMQKGLLEMHKRSVEYVIADYFNRATGQSGSQLLAADGMYPIDNARPNPNPDAPTWSNLEATAAISEDSLFAASLNASQQIDEDGNLFPQTIKKVVIRPGERGTMWTLLNSKGVLGSNYNNANWAAGFFDMKNVIVYDYLTTDSIFYWLCDPKDEDNELMIFKRKEPEIKTGWGLLASNPDVLGMRLRADWGLNLGDVRRSIRGGLVTPTT